MKRRKKTNSFGMRKQRFNNEENNNCSMAKQAGRSTLNMWQVKGMTESSIFPGAGVSQWQQNLNEYGSGYVNKDISNVVSEHDGINSIISERKELQSTSSPRTILLTPTLILAKD